MLHIEGRYTGGKRTIWRPKCRRSHNRSFPLRPQQPCRNDQHFQPPSNPKHNLHLPRPLRYEPPKHRTNQYPHKRHRPPIPLNITLQRRRKIRIARDVAQHRRQHHGRNLSQIEHTTPDDLARGLETQQRDRNLRRPVDVAGDRYEIAIHEVRLCDRGRDEHHDGL